MKKNIIKLMLDIIMILILVLMYNSHVFPLGFHEVAGLALCGLFIIHCLLNKKWIASITKKLFTSKITIRSRIVYITNLLLLIVFILLLISGIKTSQVLFPEFAEAKGTIWRSIHHFAGAMSMILVGVHLGLHWRFITGMFKKIILIPANIAKPLSICLTIIIVMFGIYNISVSSFSSWLVEPFTSIETKNANVTISAPENTKSNLVNATFVATTGDENKSGHGDNNDHTQKEGENKEGSSNEKEPSNTENKSESKSEEISSTNILSTIMIYSSIIGVFAVITYYLDKLLNIRKRKKDITNT